MARPPRMKFTKPLAVRVGQAARMIGASPRTIERCIAAGQLTAYFLPGAGLGAAKRIPFEQVKALATGKAKLRVIDLLAGKPADWWERDRLLQAKAIRLAEARGEQVVLDLLAKLGVARIADLDEQQQHRFNGQMMRAAGHVGDSRTTAWRRRKERLVAAREPEPWELVARDPEPWELVQREAA